MKEDIKASERFRPRITRRDWLGISAAWSGLAAATVAAFGAMRLPWPWVFPEASPRVKLGPPDRFAVGKSVYFEKAELWLYRDKRGFHAISAVCTHLGCLVKRQGDGSFKCPCHGSQFAPDGTVTHGPAPRDLHWLKLSTSPEGWLVADTIEDTKKGQDLKV